jgi:peptidyl-prolyl cis-trans isomerase C
MIRFAHPTVAGVGAACLAAALSVGAQTVAPAPQSLPPSAAARAQLSTPDTELLHSSKVTLTRGDYDTRLLALPEDSRSGFGASIDRINTLLRAILVDKTLAIKAREEGLDKDPETQRILAAETERILATAKMRRDEKQWTDEFNARPNLEEAARERWLTQADRYREPGELQVTEIKYAVGTRSAAEAKDKASDARRRIIGGADMATIAKAESDDPAAAKTGGKLDWINSHTFDDQRLARGVYGLKDVGEVSRPIETDDAVYLFRLDARRPGEVKPFDSVKRSIIAELRKAYVDTKRNEMLTSIRNDPTVVVNEPALQALVVRIDPSIARNPPLPPGVLERMREREGRPPVNETGPTPDGTGASPAAK